MKRSFTAMLLVPFLALAACVSGQGTAPAQTGKAVEGLWSYTGLTSSSGASMPLAGVFLFKDGIFLQQAVFEGAQIERQGAMAHSGPYTRTPAGVNLVAEQTISISPGTDAPLSFRPNTNHVLTVDRAGDRLKLTFGSGTVQTFERVGAGSGDIYNLQNGRFALVDGHFILVTGDANGAVTGYGRYTRTGDRYDLDVVRWAEVIGGQAKVQRDVRLSARFDGRTLSLPDGRQFAVAR